MFQIGSWSHPEQGQVVAGEEQGRPEPVQVGLRDGEDHQECLHGQDQGGGQGRGQRQEDSLLQVE